MCVRGGDQWGRDPETLTAQRKLPSLSFSCTPSPPSSSSKQLPHLSSHPLLHNLPPLYFLPFPLYRKHTQESPVGFSALTANTPTHTGAGRQQSCALFVALIFPLSAWKIYTPLSSSVCLCLHLRLPPSLHPSDLHGCTLRVCLLPVFLFPSPFPLPVFGHPRAGPAALCPR